mgnify:CR=1 FL=1
MPTDQGIMAYRRHIKKSIEELKKGKEPEQPKKYVGTIKTYGQDTVLKAPKRNIDDKKLEEMDLIENTRKKIAGYKLPKTILFTDEVQRAPNGKANYKWAKSFAAEKLS